MSIALVPADSIDSGRDVASREQRLRARVATLRARQPAGSRDRWLLTAGGLLMPVGVVLILLGWTGASRTPLVFEQIPYMISGGLLGLALVFAGGFAYFSYWQTLMVREQRQARNELAASLRRLEEILTAAPVASAERVAIPPQGPGLETEPLVATPKGSMMHRPDCAAVAGRERLRTVTADTPGLIPCRLCDPLDEV